MSSPRTNQYLSLALFFGLLLWGGYTLLYYLGVPVHGVVLWTEAAHTHITEVCADTDALCRGFFGLIPFVLHALGRAAPFVWYVIVSVLAYGLFVFLRRGDGGGELRLRFSCKPWQALALFVLLLWLMFTVLSYGSDKGQPTRYYHAPSEQAYNVSEQGLRALTQDYTKLQEWGCLLPIGQTESGVAVYSLRGFCMQASFVTRILSQLVFILLLFFEFLVLGRFLLSLLRIRREDMGTEALLSVGLGATGGIIILWVLAVAHLFVPIVGWGLLIAIPLAGYQHARYWLSVFTSYEWDIDVKPYDVCVPLSWLLLSYLALNFLSVVRPFPIGWDDLGSYLNRPRLLVSYGHFIHSMAPFDWAYLTSLGFLLFGYDTAFGATASMLINWSAGLLALLAVVLAARGTLGKRAGLLAALLYYSLPLVGHFSFADMKIDNAVFFFGVMATYVVFEAVLPSAEETEGTEETEETEEIDPRQPSSVSSVSSASSPKSPTLSLLLLGGIFAGMAFATKPTAVMVIMALLAVLAGVLLHWSAFVGAVAGAFFVFSFQGIFSIDEILGRIAGVGTAPTTAASTAATIFIVLCLAIAAGCVGYALYARRRPLDVTLKAIAMFVAGLAIAVGPWLLHNNILRGNIIPTLELGAPNTLSPTIAPRPNQAVEDYGQPIKRLPPELAVNTDSPFCTSTGSREELDRYWGYSNGLGHYLTLPWRSVMNIDSVGYYVTMVPALLLFPFVLLLPFFWTRRGRWLRWMVASTLFLLVEWMFLANGIPWYGIGIFLGLVIGLEALVARAPDRPTRIVAGVMLALSLFIAFSMRFWQFETQRNILEYGQGKISAEALEEITIPLYDDIRDVVTQRHTRMPQQPYLYRVGTFIPYFIPRNLEVIGINDHQLDVFNCLFAERDAALTLKRLQTLGFNSIVFDTNTHTIESDPNGSLHQKVEAFLDFANVKDLGMEIVVNDPGLGVALILLPSSP